MAQRVCRGIALLFHDRGTRRWWVVSSTLRPHCTPGKDPVLILQEAGWAPGPVWTGWISRPHRDSIPDHPPRSQSLYRLSYPAHVVVLLVNEYYSGDQIKRNKIGGACRTCGRRWEVHAWFWWGNTRERGHLEDPGIHGWLIFKWISKKWEHVYWIDLTQDRGGWRLLWLW